MNAKGGAFSAGAISEAQLAGLVSLLDAQDSMGAVVELRGIALRWLSQDFLKGRVLLDMGCGAGTQIVDLAQRLQATTSAAFVGIDASPQMCQVARDRAERAGADVSIVDAVAEDVPLANGSVGGLVCERVLQHVEDPSAVVSEMRRLLCPLGRFAITDTDWSSVQIHTGSEHGDEVLKTAMADAQIAVSSSPNQRMGAELCGLIQAAGLVVDETHTRLIDEFPPDMIRARANTLLTGAVRTNSLTPRAAEGIEQLLVRADSAVRMTVPLTICCGHRPAGGGADRDHRAALIAAGAAAPPTPTLEEVM